LARRVGDKVTISVDNQYILGKDNCQSMVLNFLISLLCIGVGILVILTLFGIVSAIDSED
jgi:hypothetical protein